MPESIFARANLAIVSNGGASESATRWLAKNKQALESSNAYVERHGLPLARYRQF